MVYLVKNAVENSFIGTSCSKGARSADTATNLNEQMLNDICGSAHDSLWNVYPKAVERFFSGAETSRAARQDLGLSAR